MPAQRPLIIHTEAPDVVLVELCTEQDDTDYFDGIITSTDHLSTFEAETVEKYREISDVRRSRVNASANSLRFGIRVLGAEDLGVSDDELRAGVRPGRFAGSIKATVGPKAVEIGYWRKAERIRKGCVTLAAHALAEMLHKQGETVFARVIPGNLASAAVLEQAGFVHILTLDEGADGLRRHFVYDPDRTLGNGLGRP